MDWDRRHRGTERCHIVADRTCRHRPAPPALDTHSIDTGDRWSPESATEARRPLYLDFFTPIRDAHSMATDKAFYELGRLVPDLIVRLAGIEAPGAYRWTSPVVKELERRFDGVLVPHTDELPLLFAEFQGYHESTRQAAHCLLRLRGTHRSAQRSSGDSVPGPLAGLCPAPTRERLLPGPTFMYDAPRRFFHTSGVVRLGSMRVIRIGTSSFAGFRPSPPTCPRRTGRGPSAFSSCTSPPGTAWRKNWTSAGPKTGGSTSGPRPWSWTPFRRKNSWNWGDPPRPPSYR